jgi:hypothetical protein
MPKPPLPTVVRVPERADHGRDGVRQTGSSSRITRSTRPSRRHQAINEAGPCGQTNHSQAAPAGEAERRAVSEAAMLQIVRRMAVKQ